jgi:predicted GH43/DUF377 family glycosyl hydrolase
MKKAIFEAAVLLCCGFQQSASAVDDAVNPAWKAEEKPVYTDPVDQWAKDPSIIKAGDTYYMYYTSANPWQDTGNGGQGEPRIDYATSHDGINWTRQGVAIAKGKAGEWDDTRPQAPAKPILKDGVYYLYYAGAGKGVTTGYATSTDLKNWTKSPKNPVLHQGKCNDPFVYLENGTYYLFYTSGGDSIHYVTSSNLIDWSPPVATGATGEGSVLVKEGSTYRLFGCIGFSLNGEYYKEYTTSDLAKPFTEKGRININTPEFARGALCHGDILIQGNEYWFYFQGTRDNGKRFDVGLAKQPIPAAAEKK